MKSRSRLRGCKDSNERTTAINGRAVALPSEENKNADMLERDTD